MRSLASVLVAAAVLVALVACDEGEDDIVVPEVTGTISGTVTVDGVGMAGVTVSLSNGRTATSGSTGSFTFTNVPSGAYTVAISGYPSNVVFPATTQAAVVATAGQNVSMSFSGNRVAGSTAPPPASASPATAGRPPTVGPIRASLRPPTTIYTVDATDPDGDTLTYQWRNTNLCGTFRPRDAQAVWEHPHPPCGNETSHPGTITVDVSDGKGNVVRRTYEGSSEGVGPAGSP